MTRRSFLWLCAGLLVFGAALRAPSLSLPLDRDEGEYASLAWLWSSGQGLPYRDWVEQKPPAGIGVNAVAQAVFADGVRGLRWVSLLWTALTVLALGLLVLGLLRRCASDPSGALRAAALAGLLAALLLSSARTQSLAANTEAWVSLPLIAALWLCFVAEGGWARYAAAGLLLGIASLFKQPLLAGALILPLAAAAAGRRSWACAASLAAALMPWFALVLSFALRGAADDLLYCTWGYNGAYISGAWAAAWAPGLGLARRLLPELGGSALLAAWGWHRLGAGPLRRAMGAWLGVALILLLASPRFYPHYAIGLLAPVAALAGLAFAGPSNAWVRWGRGGILALALLGWGVCNAPLWSAPDGAARSRLIYGLDNFAQAPKAAEWIRNHSRPQQRLFVWGDEAELYYLSQRAPASRFLFTYPFTGEAPPWLHGADDLRRGLHAPGVGVAVLAKPLDPNDPLQAEIMMTLSARFDGDASVPPYILGRAHR